MKVISGGQTGVDRGALLAALDLHLEIGGRCPAGYRAEDGVIPEPFRHYLHPTRSLGCGLRTKLNVHANQGTLIITYGPIGRGTKLALDYARQIRKPWLALDLSRWPIPKPEDLVLDWLTENKIAVLNVAGPRASRALGIQARTRVFLVGALSAYLQSIQ